jgi:peptidoglycan/LPS O-acetylase OafA/YrhL
LANPQQAVLGEQSGESGMNEERLAGRVDRIAILDGYRALAIVAVMAFHYTIRWTAPHDVPAHIRAASLFVGFVPFEYGWMGVELFFVISGFVILMTLKRCSGPADFARRRFARLWPALIVGAALTGIVVNWIGPPDWKIKLVDYLTSLTLINPRLFDFTGLNANWVDGAYWSLWVELRFYFLIAALFFPAKRHFLKSWLAVQFSAALVWLALPAVRHKVTFFDFLPYFTVGICAFELWSKSRERQLALAGTALAAGMILYAAAAGRGVFAGCDPTAAVAANLLIFLLFALLLRGSPLLRPFAWPPVVALGEASYSLYLFHEAIGVSLLQRFSGLPFLLALALTVAICIAAALAMRGWVEVPAKAWLTESRSGNGLNVLQETLDSPEELDRDPVEIVRV